MNAPIIAFRADASVDIGLGHVMRCLTLASVLQEKGARCHFLCRDLPGHLAATIRARGVECHLLPAADAPEDDGTTAHSRWLGVSSKRDAAQSREVLDRLSPDWLVVDHYALDATWERATRPDGARLLVVDDLANRPHECEILLDQNLGRDARDYTGLVEDRCALLIGPTYALLRPEFAAHRAASLARRKAHRLAHILVSLGGVDRDDVTSRVLDSLAAYPLPADSRITVVLGPSAPAREAVARRAAQMPVPTKLCIGADNMAALMTEADLAIGAGGSTSWERCCLGLPTLIAVLASNQASAAKALEASGAVLVFDHASAPADGLSEALTKACDPMRLSRMATKAAAICDGSGCIKVADHMMQSAANKRIV
nr:UDP-2,4-diacetamido-2,4,6-trideoxy-beta-L-altropyranose hydrolase [uncultured Roseovarius sp.]